MRVLVIMHKDVYNIPTYHIVKEMLGRGYNLDFFAFFSDDIHMRMFYGLNIQIHDIRALNYSDLGNYDFIYSSVNIDVLPRIMQIRKYIFTFSTTFMDEIASYGDYTFTQRDCSNCFQNGKYSVEVNNIVKFRPGKAVGNPKFDVEDILISDDKERRQILFVEASHYPYGKSGKMEEARMLLDIVKKCPKYRIIVKPRYFPEDENVTHRNKIHLYQCIEELTGGKIPDNLILLRQHMDLERLVCQSSVIVVTEMTTSYLDIGFYKKRGIIACDFPSESSLVHHIDHVRRFKEIQKRSGLCVNYKDVADYLPNGLMCRQEHIVEMGLDKKNVSQSIVNEMERIYTHYIMFNRYPSPDNANEYITMDEVITYRYLKRLYNFFDRINENIEDLNFDEAADYVKKLWDSKEVITQENFAEHQNNIFKIIHDTMLDSKKILMKDALSQSYYLETLYVVGKIQDADINEYAADAMYYCLMGKYETIKLKEYERAIKHFERYFSIISKNEFEKTLADTSYYIESATFWMGVCYYELSDFSEARKYFLKCEELTNNGHRAAADYLKRMEG